ncbi:MAG: Smr/MutS family protein [Pseudomonadota bacterium]
MSRRKLTPDELELWQRVTSTTRRLHLQENAKEMPFVQPKPTPAKQPAPLKKFSVGQNTAPGKEPLSGATFVPDTLASSTIQMDLKKHGQLKRGKLDPEARIDLHGMTLARAQPKLTGFIMDSHAKGKRLVLVITGKGKDRDEGGPIPMRQGVLRHAVPQWLAAPPLSKLVLQITQAHGRHGGGGAYYVYLRRSR